jgi:integrase/recombinase XerD
MVLPKPSQTRVISVAREQRIVKTLTQEQVKQLLDACTHQRDKFLLTLLSECGIRIGQALGLRHGDLSVEDNEIHIVPRRDNANGARAKTRRSYVIPAVSPSVMQCYTDYLIEELSALEADHLPDYVFVNLWSGEIGRPMTYDAVRSLFRHLSKKTAIAVTPHHYRFHFILTSPSLRTEVKYVVWSKFNSGRWKRDGDHRQLASDLKYLMKWFNRFTPPV